VRAARFVIRIRVMRTDIAQQLERVLNQLMLPGTRGRLCAPVIAAAPPGLDAQTWPVLHVLGRTGPCSAARLADEIGIDRSGASRYADRLEEIGLVQRTADPIDRRATLLSLTAEGRRVIDELDGVLADYLHEMLREWPRGQAEALVDGLERLVDWGRPAGRRSATPAASLPPARPRSEPN
jgi:DNA-binding MarR family transcriptional regulator